ncbi:MAG: DUF1778 domain-containing protein [Methylococcales bacterium]
MTKNARLEARIAPDIHALIKRAAEIQGRTLSDFIVSAARDAAMETIEQTEMIFLSRADQERFAAELLATAPLSGAMERAIEKHKELVGPFE